MVVLPVMSSSVEPTAPVRGEEQEGNGFSLFPSNPAVLPREKGERGERRRKFSLLSHLFAVNARACYEISASRKKITGKGTQTTK